MPGKVLGWREQWPSRIASDGKNPLDPLLRMREKHGLGPFIFLAEPYSSYFQVRTVVTGKEFLAHASYFVTGE